MFMHLRFAFTLAVGAGIVCSAAAHAADNTRYVSITGSNANACTLAAPCRTFQRGVNVTPAGGELRILDSGDSGVNATIKKSLTVTGNGNTVYLGKPITIDQADAVVALRGLVLNGQGTVADGISIVQAKAVHVERCVIHGYTNGIHGNEGTRELSVLDRIVRDNEVFGILVAAVESRLTVNNSQVKNNNRGISVDGGRAAINRSTASGNGNVAFEVINGGTMMVESSLIHANGHGLRVDGGESVMRVSNSTITDNAVGLNKIFGDIETRVNNTLRGNDAEILEIGGTIQTITPF